MSRRIAILCFLIAACHRQAARQPVVVLTTPALAATGATRRLVDAFEKESGRHIDMRIVTAEQILAAADSRTGAVAMYRSPQLDEQLTQRHGERLRSIFAYEDYELVGPERDPAHVRGSPTAQEAFRRIAQQKRRFCSPADVASAANIEREIWSAAQINPKSLRHHTQCHGNAADVLATAARLQAYTVLDRASVVAGKPAQLAVLGHDIPMLHYAYIVALLQSNRQNRDAEWLVEWVMSYRGREVVENLQSPVIPKLYLPELH
ncbi:MAG TPA: hypothetical protein VLV78_18805 [Thermoanaerobaculia bacterium]|nr:hypothetical protein [Thermoanaerobaculia bacterium]